MHTFKNYGLNKCAKRQKYQWVLNGQMLPGRICITNSILEYHVNRAPHHENLVLMEKLLNFNTCRSTSAVNFLMCLIATK